jgi:DNA-binding NarL/FixJ family response regulator
MNRTRVLLADDHVMLLDVLSSFLDQECEIVGTVQDGQAAVDAAVRIRPDLLLLDIEMPRLNGIEAARVLQKEGPCARILMMSMYSDISTVEEAFRAGASGYMLKTGDLDELVRAIRCIANGGRYVTPFLGDLISTMLAGNPTHSQSGITPRQREVLQLLAQGKTMKEIGHVLNISPKTIESHKYELMRSLGLKTTAELVRYAVRNKLVQSDVRDLEATTSE